MTISNGPASIGLFSILLTTGLCQQTINSDLPGAKIQLSQSGLHYAARVAIDVLAANIKKENIPDQSGSSRVTYDSMKITVDYAVTNMKLHDFTKPSSSVVVNEGSGITWSLNNAGVVVSGSWQYQYKLFGFLTIRDSGNFEAKVIGASASVGVALEKDAKGRPSIRFLRCSSTIVKIDIDFLKSAGAPVYKMFSSIVAGPVETKVEKTICDVAQRTINGNTAEQLATLKTSVTLENGFVIDYQFVENIVYGKGYIQSAHKGEVFHVSDRSEAPFSPRPIATAAPQKMMTVYVSEYIVNTLGYVLHKRNILSRVLTRNEVSAKDRALFAVNCTAVTGLCFGRQFPTLATRYPNSFVEFDVTTTERPTLVISAASLNGTVKVKIDVFARLPNATRTRLFTFTVTCAISLTAGIRGNVITANVTKLIPTFSVVSSNIGTVLQDRLNLLIIAALDFIVLPKLNDIGQRGFAIPSMDKVQFEAPTLALVSGAVVISTDLRYTP